MDGAACATTLGKTTLIQCSEDNAMEALVNYSHEDLQRVPQGPDWPFQIITSAHCQGLGRFVFSRNAIKECSE